MSKTETILLHNVRGNIWKAGKDERGKEWLEFENDVEIESVECSICGETIASGWMCLNGGKKVCNSHVSVLAAVFVPPTPTSGERLMTIEGSRSPHAESLCSCGEMLREKDEQIAALLGALESIVETASLTAHDEEELEHDNQLAKSILVDVELTARAAIAQARGES